MRIRLIQLGLTVLATLIIIGCGGKSSPSPTGPSGSGAAATIHIPVGASTLTTTAYAPNPMTVQIGTAVTWVNDDSVSHTATSGSGVWDSGNIGPGSRFSFTFQSAGAFNYLCLVHPNMVGTITVQ